MTERRYNNQVDSYLQTLLNNLDVSTNQQIMNNLLPRLIAPHYLINHININNAESAFNSLLSQIQPSNLIALLELNQIRPNNSNISLQFLNLLTTASQEQLRSILNLSNRSTHSPTVMQSASNLASGEEDLQRAIAESMNQTYRTGSIVLPPDGPNAERAAELGEDIKIPEHYFCPLSQCVMTQPVYDPRSNTYFEKAWILKELERNPHNPCTRQPLKPEQLIPDPKLANEIDDYLTEKENEKARRMAP